MVHPSGIEPETYGLEVRCSIQLSYGCIVSGARIRTRTENLLLTRQLLCQLSYSGVAPQVGLEPTTYRLTAERSTIELLRIVNGRRDRIRTYDLCAPQHTALPNCATLRCTGADGGSRTRMSYARQILSLLCIPIPPHRRGPPGENRTHYQCFIRTLL